MHHLSSTELCCAPLSCVVHHLDADIMEKGGLFWDGAWSMDFEKRGCFLAFTLHGFWEKGVFSQCMW